MNLRKLAASAGAIAMLALPFSATAASNIVVTEGSPQGWSTADTRAGGDVNFVADGTAPAGSGALQLTTDATTTAKAQFLHASNKSLADVTELSYYAKQNSALFPQGQASYQLPVYLGGGTTGFTTLVFEPYENTDQGAVVTGTWQKWDVDAGQSWSSRSYSDGGTCTVTAGGGGAPFYTLAALKLACPNAVVAGFGVNIGSNNPGYDVEADLVSFNGTAYDFEPTLSPTDKDSCKNGGWSSFNTPSFKNQGDCVSYTQHNNGKGADDQKHSSVDQVLSFFAKLTK